MNKYKETIYGGDKFQIIFSSVEVFFKKVQHFDKDDWYLDGYTVTQKQHQYKEKLLKQRIDFCTQKDGSVSEELIQEWHVGEKAYLEGETK